MPRCAWLLIGSLLLICNQTIGLPATVDFLLATITWTATTPAALVIIAALAAHHLLTYHAPRPARARH
ncbi:hypothetical protein K4749_01230 [Streptomyces sp. TRM72054]|uniref:hypothetical protein n=1 Tax=Streptomyces sp. TRM72054 TaxID=2870562 RepID=UPI001C8BC911|nr:hypothetical protein [Streptomyces sp. TRM72054]MBX9392253.1 hypothetical protein [Streptomyces sp. TRM72054]